MESTEFSLDKLPPYCAARVERVEECGIKRRLSGLGITGGARMVRLFSAPGGDPVAYGVRGTTVALRRADAKNVIMRGEQWV